MAATALKLRVGAAVVVVEGSQLLHVPSYHRLGQGAWQTSLSSYLLAGKTPLRWTTVCGQYGTVVFHRGCLLAVPVCPNCAHPTITGIVTSPTMEGAQGE